MPMTYDIIADFANHCGEGPLYHPDEKVLYWTDIPTGRLFRYDPATGEAECIYNDRPVGGFTFQSDGSLLLFRDRGNVAVMRDGKVADTVIDHLPDEVGTRFNDVIADPAGRVFCGTMPVPKDKHQGPRKGRLYRLDTDGSIHQILEDIGCSNGMAFILDQHENPVGLYYTDTPTQHITRFDYNPDTGQVSNGKVHVDLTDIEGAPDGMTVDVQGHIYSALWGGWGVAHFDQHGKYIRTLALPAKCVTCPIFAPPGSVPPGTPGSSPGSSPGSNQGGSDTAYSSLYVTSAMAQQKPESGEHAGALFRFDLDTVGRPEYRSAIGL